jgi:pimeloyl-ACP methyl ester carboxylesterase
LPIDAAAAPRFTRSVACEGGIRVPYVRLADADVYYDSAGTRGSRILLIMGFGVPGHLWKSQIDALKDRHRVAWFDNCGAGRSRSRRWRTYSVRDLADHALSVLDALGWADAHVVGVSMGGMIAQELALRAPDRVRSLALLVTHGGALRDLFPSPRGLQLFLLGFLGPASLRAQALERLVFPEEYLGRVDRREIRRGLHEEVARAARIRDRLSQIATVFSHRTGARLSGLAHVPTVVVQAGRDLLVRPSACRRLHAAIPGAKLVVFEEAGHALLHQCAERLNGLLLSHFGEADSRRRETAERLAS